MPDASGFVSPAHSRRVTVTPLADRRCTSETPMGSALEPHLPLNRRRECCHVHVVSLLLVIGLRRFHTPRPVLLVS
ncbi:hypothetical protein OG21DRAFT_1507975 [Imleria badia]|nr:hypothetical protein OG21DRAFT_1507975 [Imleria badia]